MALEPYRQRTSVPDNAGGTVQAAVSTNVVDWGPSLARIGQQLEQTFGPRLDREAIERGLADFAADGLSKDENGNYVIPEPTDAGYLYTEAYRQASRQQFVLQTQHDAELHLNKLYTENPQRLLTDPDGLRAEAEEYVRATTEGSPEVVRQDVFDRLTRELRERDRAASNQVARQKMQEISADATVTLERIQQQITNVVTLPTEEAAAKFVVLSEEMTRFAENNEWLMPGITERTAVFLENVSGYGLSMRELNTQLEGLGAVELRNLALIASNGMEGTAAGMDYAMLVERMPDPQMRDQFARVANDYAIAQEREDRDAAAIARARGIGDYTEGFGQGYASDSDYRDAWRQWAQDNSVDLFTEEGLMQAALTFNGEVATGVYKPFLENPMNKSAQDLERLRPIYERLADFTNPYSGTTSSQLPKLTDEEMAFWHHFIVASGPDVSADDARAKAAAMIEAGLGREVGDLRSFTRKQWGFQGEGSEAVFHGKLADAVGASWDGLSREAQDYLINAAAQQAVFGVDADSGIANARRMFEREFVNDPYTAVSEPGYFDFIFGRKSNFVRREDAIPTVAQFRNTQPDEDWIVDQWSLLSGMIDRSKNPGLPEIDDLVLGENVKFVSLGLHGSTSKLFALAYQLPGQTAPYRIRGEDGEILVFDLGKAADRLSRRRAAARRQLPSIAANIRRSQPMPSFRPGTDVAGMVRAGNRGTAQAQEARRLDAAERRLEAQIPALRAEDFTAPRVDRVTARSGSMGPEFLEGYFKQIGFAESGNNPNARAGRNNGQQASSATGLFQFVDGTWLRFYRQTFSTDESNSQILAKRTDPETQRKVMETFTGHNAGLLTRAGMPINYGTLYAMHVFGDARAGGGLSFLQADPSRAISSVIARSSYLSNSKWLARGGDLSQPLTVGEVRRIIAEKAGL